MRLFRQLSRALSLFILGILFISATAQSQTITPHQGGTLTLILPSEPSALVALATVAQPVIAVSSKVNEGLLTYDYSLNPLPQLATSWDISADGLQYTFHLRKGVTWTDGQPFTSQDVAFSIDLLKKTHPRAKATFANVESISTPDPLTAVFKLSHPAPYLIRAFAAGETPILPKHIYANTDPLKNENNNHPIGTGPYIFEKWVRGSYIIYKRNPNYWDAPKPYIDQLIVKFSTDPVVRSLDLQTGQADLGYRTPVALSELKTLQKRPDLVFDYKGYNYNYSVASIYFNLDDKLFKDIRVRQAIAHSINHEALLRVVYFGYATPTESPIAPGLKAFHSAAPSPYQYDLAAANRLLDDAGYKQGSDGIRLRVTLDYNTYDDTFRRNAEFVRSALSRIGIAVTLRSQDISTYAERVFTRRDFQFSIDQYANLYDPTVGVQRLYWSKNYRLGVPWTNITHYNNPAVDKLLEAAQTENDAQKRIDEFRQFQDIVQREVPDIPLASPQFITLANKRVHDSSPTADGVEGNLSSVWVDPKP
ncbi:ABC transporter substrate-binding protein [Rouxiella badensis]|uniref:ABC transporter substrate-binding protein n=1 Tax=Rouxiella badensis TaxID=1646377 RepID=UPI001D152CDE|nr:ABC transporter substrate-binding protein [Rouxiella badensis]MCC3718878.1 ABC transporter substrate-binding protein [Rouxiella badensis]MCC3727783.1 ABC transporter substrate-binding protein [Rouxiella badensis]MCC3739527.1 ABC transporter substrate-binding protein [Rouxiella badensis]